MLIEAETDDDKTGDHEEGGDVVGGKTAFWLENAIVFLDVSGGDEVVEVVTKDFTDGNSDERCEVEVTNRLGAEAVSAGFHWSLEEDRGGDVDTDSPVSIVSTSEYHE